MPIALHLSQPQPNIIEANGPFTNQQRSETRRELLDAILRNDWTSFEHLAFEQENGIDIETERDSRGRSYLHRAITAGSYTLAANLVWVCLNEDIDLIDTPDAYGHTPIMCAADAESDNAELIDTLLNAGACIGLSYALKSAAQKGHLGMAERLMDSDVDVAQVLAELIEDRGNQPEGLVAAKLLIALGADASQALNYAAQRQLIDTAGILILLGAKGSDALIAAVAEHAAQYANGTRSPKTLPHSVKNLRAAGSDVVMALTTVAKKPPSIANTQTARLLVKLDRLASENHTHADLPNDTLALLCLARHSNTASLCALAEVSETEGLACQRLAEHGDIDALKALIDAGLVHTDTALREIARNGNLFAAKTLIAAGGKTTTLLEKLYAECMDGYLGKLESLKLLVLAGADTSSLALPLTASINRRKIAISKLSLQEKNAALLQSVRYQNVPDVVMLLESGAEIIRELQALSRARELDSIKIVLNASTNPIEPLIDRLRANDTGLARTLIQAKDLSTAALEHLIKIGDLASARILLAIEPTMGQNALVQAIQMDDAVVAEGLLEIGTDGPGALLFLLETNQRESAVRLTALGVDVHTTFTRAVKNNCVAPLADLRIIGAMPSTALIQALSLGQADDAQKIVNQYPESAAQEAAITLLDDDTLTKETKSARLRSLLDLSFSKDPVLRTLINDGKTSQLKTLVALVETDNLLMEFGKNGNRIDARKLILAGADYINPIKTLEKNEEYTAVTLLGLALAGARDSMIASRIRPNLAANHSPNT